MNFQLPFQVNDAPLKINHEDRIFSIGSCFADEMGTLLSDFKFNCLHNPFGVIFNPLSINTILENANTQKSLEKEDIIESKGIYYHWDAHSRISGLDSTALEKLYTRKIAESHHQLSQAKWLIITWGTSWVYEYLPYQKLVANCHKIPAALFSKRLLTPKEIFDDTSRAISSWRINNPDLNILFTISPVRHIKDGLIENNQSKAVLIQAAREVMAQTKNCYYFPAYEIMIDVLRDYRFYKEDLIHPNGQAVEYIWQLFLKTYMSYEAMTFIDEWQQIMRALTHRPFHPSSAEHQKFLNNTLEKLYLIQQKVDVSTEIDQIRKQLI